MVYLHVYRRTRRRHDQGYGQLQETAVDDSSWADRGRPLNTVGASTYYSLQLVLDVSCDILTLGNRSFTPPRGYTPDSFVRDGFYLDGCTRHFTLTLTCPDYKVVVGNR